MDLNQILNGVSPTADQKVHILEATRTWHVQYEFSYHRFDTWYNDNFLRLYFYQGKLKSEKKLTFSEFHFETETKATVTRCDLSPRFFCTDAKLLCEFESDKI